MSQYRPQRNNVSKTNQQQKQDSSLQQSDYQQLKNPQLTQEQNTLPRSTYRTPDTRVNHFDGISNEEIYKKKINELQRQNDELREKYLQLSSENQVIIQEQREEIEQYINEVNILKEQLMQMEIEIKQLNELNYSLKQEISDWEDGFDKLEQDYNNKLKIEDDYQKILIKVQQLNEENQNLQDELQEKDILYNQCKQQLQNIQIDFNQLQQDNQYNQELLSQKDIEINELQQQLERDKELLKKQQEFSNKQDLLTKDIQKLNQQLKQLQKENQDMKNEKILISQELQENRASPEYLTKINLLGQEVERLNNTLALKSRENNDQKAFITRMQKEIQNLRMNEFKLQDMNMSLDNLINQYNKLKEDNQILKQQMAQKQIKVNSELDKNIQLLQQERDKLSSQLNTSKKENDYLREQLNVQQQLEDANRLLKQQVDKLQMQIKQLENERQTLMQEYQLLSNSYNNQKFNYSQLLQEQQENNDSVFQLKNEIQRLQKIMQDTIETNLNNNNLQEIINQQQKELDVANKQISLLKQTIQKLKNELDITKEFITENKFEQQQQPFIQQDIKLIDKLQKYEIRFPQLIEEIERLNKILTERNEEILIYKKNSFQQDQELEKVSAYEGEIERLRQTIILKQQTIDQLQQQKEKPEVQDLIFKLQDENRRLTSILSVRNNEIAEIKFKLSEYEQKQKLLGDSNSGKYELQNQMLNQEIDQLNQKLLEAKNEISLLKLTKNDKFNEERGKVLTQELDKQIRINKDNEKELMSLRLKFAEVIDVERKLIDCKCLLNDQIKKKNMIICQFEIIFIYLTAIENNRFYANQPCQRELEQQLKDSFLENKLLKQENKYLSSTFEEFKLKQEETRKLQSLVLEQEQRVLILEEENAKLENEIGYLRGFSQSKEIQMNQKPSYTQLEQELQDLQIYLKKFIQLQEFLIEQIPNINLQLCWKEINQIFKSQFNTNQSVQNLQDELKLIETIYKELVHQKDNSLTPLQEMAKQQSIRESRVEIERIRKEVQLNQMDLKQFEMKLNGLQNEFTYISKIETRKNNVQIEAEKQLIEFRRGISSTKNSNHNVSLMRDTFKERDTYKEMIPDRLRDQLDVLPVTSSINRLQKPYIEINDRYDDYQEIKTPIEKTIDQTRQKLNRQLSQANSLRDKKYI